MPAAESELSGHAAVADHQLIKGPDSSREARGPRSRRICRPEPGGKLPAEIVPHSSLQGNRKFPSRPLKIVRRPPKKAGPRPFPGRGMAVFVYGIFQACSTVEISVPLSCESQVASASSVRSPASFSAWRVWVIWGERST